MISWSFPVENDHPLLQSAVLLSQVTEVSTVDGKIVLHHTAPGWTCKIKGAKAAFAFFNLVFWCFFFLFEKENCLVCK